MVMCLGRLWLWGFIALILAPLTATAQSWTPVVKEAALSSIMTDTVLVGDLVKGVRSKTTFNADGTGELQAWNGRFPRTWKIQNDQVCVVIDDKNQCFRIELNDADPAQYRAVSVASGVATAFTIEGQESRIEGGSNTSDAGGAASPSAEEMALKLSNPTAPVMTLGNNIDYVMFDGDLDGASDESSVRYLFQSVFPFKLDEQSSILFRPGIPVFFDEPVPELGGGLGDDD
jgi:hypothetical protein